jgi:adenylylsulfate kinase-like enzyme
MELRERPPMRVDALSAATPEDRPPGAESGSIYWITGLPGVGKKTLARSLALRLTRKGRPVITSSGDSLRRELGDRFGYTQRDRHAISQAYSRVCRELSKQGPDVVFSTVSMFEDVRRWNRAHLESYCEIYLKTSIDVLVARHPKGLYAAARAGRIRHVPGHDQPVEEPQRPDIVLVDDGRRTAADIANELFVKLDAFASETAARPRLARAGPEGGARR